MGKIDEAPKDLLNNDFFGPAFRGKRSQSQQSQAGDE
jgi:hypothetical protein